MNTHRFHHAPEAVTPEEKQRKTDEWRTWLFFAIVLAPVLAVAIVSGFGFAIWIWQLFAGPPTY